MKKAKIFTIINYIFSGVLWGLGILTFLLNLLRYWELWQGVGFAFIRYAAVPIIPLIFAFVFSIKEKSRKMIILNFISLAISIGIVLFTVFVSATWE